MIEFVNRFDEMKLLEEEYSKNTASFTVIYGRRRVGKTSLTSEFLKGKPYAVYYMATREGEIINKDNFKKQIAAFIDNPLLEQADVEWLDIFKQLVDFKPRARKIIVIDEFQYIGMSNPAFPSVFQKAWDTMLSKHNVMLIICGSLLNMMESQVLSYNSPLYGRRTSQIKLKQIDFRFYRAFFPTMPFADMVMFYSVTGGVPKYIETVMGSKNIYKAIENKVLSKQSYLYEEPHFLLSQEVKETGSYFSILRVIALGNRKLGNIAAAIGKSPTDLTKPLGTLIDLDLVEREVPITEAAPNKSKKGLYKIKDNFISFWFKYVYVHLASLERGETGYVMEQIKKSFIDNHVSFVYEDVAREKMWELNSQDTWDFRFNKLGRYWDSSTEVDIVAIDSVSKNIIMGECKFSINKKGHGVLNDLKKKEQTILREVPKGKIVSYVIFSRAGFTNELMQLAKADKSIVLVSSQGIAD